MERVGSSASEIAIVPDVRRWTSIVRKARRSWKCGALAKGYFKATYLEGLKMD